MLGDAIGGLLPAAIGVALSPIPIVAVILILGTPKARANGPAFAIGWVAGLVIVSTVVVLVVGDNGDDPSSGTSTGIAWTKVVLGALLVVLAAKQWRSRPKPGETATLPKWMATVDGFTPVKSLALGALLSGVNPKNLALTLAASASIAQAGLSAGDTVVSIAVFVILGSLTVAGPVVLFVFGGTRVRAPLASLKEFMAAHNNVIMMVVLLILGAKLLGDGISGLSS
jgi:threonine/homoserine/homoserine lactone efflux protein